MSVLEALPSCGPADVPVDAVLDLWYGSSLSSLIAVLESGRVAPENGVRVIIDVLRAAGRSWPARRRNCF